MPVTNIDDVLTAEMTGHDAPKTPENPPEEKPKEPDLPTNEAESEQESDFDNPDTEKEPEPEPESDSEDTETDDEYGLNEESSEDAEERKYTKAEVDARINEAVRDRLERLQRNQSSGQQQQFQQHVQDNFQADPNSGDSWETQLQNFVKQTIQNYATEQQQQQQQIREQEEQRKFETKFYQGVAKFKDFNDVVGDKPFSDAMVIATRSMSNPASFMYAASKRHPEEIERIAKLRDPSSQMVEIGKLDERMKKNKQNSKAPKSIGHTKDSSNVSTKTPEKKQLSGTDLIERAIKEQEDKLYKMRGH